MTADSLPRYSAPDTPEEIQGDLKLIILVQLLK